MPETEYSHKNSILRLDRIGEYARVIFLHFFDHDTIELFKIENSYSTQQINVYLEKLARIALLVCRDFASIPAAACFEKPYGSWTLSKLAPFVEIGLLRVSGNAADPYGFRAKKESYFSSDPQKFPAYFTKDMSLMNELDKAWYKKERTSTHDMTRAWKLIIETGNPFWKDLFTRHGLIYTGEEENELYFLPDKLSDTVFNVESIIESVNIPQIFLFRDDINALVTLEWMRSHQGLISATFLKDFTIFETSPTIPPESMTLSVLNIKKIISALGIENTILYSNPTDLLKTILLPEWFFFRQYLIIRSIEREIPIAEILCARDISTKIIPKSSSKLLPLEIVAQRVNSFLITLQYAFF